jgi:hypothetical protein
MPREDAAPYRCFFAPHYGFNPAILDFHGGSARLRGCSLLGPARWHVPERSEGRGNMGLPLKGITAMADTSTSSSVLDSEFLTLRGKILEVAATLDRIARAGDSTSDPRLQQVQQTLEILRQSASTASRAEQMQMIFSLPYSDQWMREYGVKLPESATR